MMRCEGREIEHLASDGDEHMALIIRVRTFTQLLRVEDMLSRALLRGREA